MFVQLLDILPDVVRVYGLSYLVFNFVGGTDRGLK